MAEPSYPQYRILKNLYDNGKKGFISEDMTEDQLVLVRTGYARNLASFGVYHWMLGITEKGAEYVRLHGGDNER